MVAWDKVWHTMSFLPGDDEPTYFRQVGILTIVWTLILVLAAILLLAFGNAIMGIFA